MKRGASIIAVGAALAVVCWIFPAFHVVPLKQAQAEKAAGAFNAADFAAKFWRERLTPALDKAPDAVAVLTALSNDAKAAATNYGRTVGMSDTTYYLMRGTGKIVSLESGVGVALRDGATEPELLLKTGLLFGNTVRDASGQLKADAFQNSKEFNDVSTELNRIVEAQVIPALKTNAAVGRKINFIVCAEISEDDAGERPLKVIPVRVELPMKPISKESLARFQSLIALVVMVVFLSVKSDNFLTVSNGMNILLQISVNLCLSIGMTLIILTGGIDLSVGAILALSGAVAAGLLKNGLTLAGLGVQLQFTPFGAVIAGIVVGLALGWFNGMAITRFKLPPFVATLGMLSIARGLTMLWTGGFPITRLGPEFGFIGAGFWLGVPMAVWICLALVVLFYVLSMHTTLGRYIYAVGGNERAAAFTGLNVNRVKIWVYALGGGLAGMAGLLVTARLDSATPNAGLGYELDSIAAVVIGGTSLSGGRGSVLGTALGCLIIGVLNNGLVLLDVNAFWQQVIKGAVILIAVIIDKAGNKGERT